MTIHIFMHRQVPVRDIKVLLARFFKGESHESAFGDENIEKQVGDLRRISKKVTLAARTLSMPTKLIFKRLCTAAKIQTMGIVVRSRQYHR